MLGDSKKSLEHLENLTKKIEFYCCLDEKKIEKLGKIVNIQSQGKTFTMIYITNKKLILKNYDIKLGDTDSFLKQIS